MLTANEVREFLQETPYLFGKQVGFDKLTPLHNDWMISMMDDGSDDTLQAHRGSYKTTCLSVSMSILMVLRPSLRIMFMRKTDADVKEVINQVQKIILSDAMQYYARCLFKTPVTFLKASSTELTTTLDKGIKGTPQLVGIGTKSSITGKHFDRIFTDDIVNMEDRSSQAERERVKRVYMELQNIKNRNGSSRIFNSGTPWHKDDAFTLMPTPTVWDCYRTGLMTQKEIDDIKSKMTSSLFAANYEMRHIAEDDVLFPNPVVGADISLVFGGKAHVDAAYYGEDFTAFTVCAVHDGKYYVFGKLWRKHIDDCIPEICVIHENLRADKLWNEKNADKGYVAKEFKKRGLRTVSYDESENKYIKISSWLKFVWNSVVFVEGTDKAYIEQIEEYNENAEHDDAPDSLASLIRAIGRPKGDFRPALL